MSVSIAKAVQGQESKRKSTRSDSRSEATKRAIIEKAEELFARHGVDGVSLRQIGKAIASKNTNLLGYHFGDKEALLKAIYHYRFPAIEARRAELVAALKASGKERDLFQLLYVMWLPVFEGISNGQAVSKNYAGFLNAMMRSDWQDLRAGLHAEFPTTTDLVAYITTLVPESVRPLLDQRIRNATIMITSVLAQINKEELDVTSAEALFADVIRMAAAGVRSPIDS